MLIKINFIHLLLRKDKDEVSLEGKFISMYYLG